MALLSVPITQYRAPGRPSRPSQSTRSRHVCNTRNGAQISPQSKRRMCIYTRNNSRPRQYSQARPLCRYGYPIHPNKSSLTRVMACGGPALTLNSNKPMPNLQLTVLVSLVCAPLAAMISNLPFLSFPASPLLLITGQSSQFSPRSQADQDSACKNSQA